MVFERSCVAKASFMRWSPAVTKKPTGSPGAGCRAIGPHWYVQLAAIWLLLVTSPPDAGRPSPSSLVPHVCHCPPRFIAIPSVYWIPPVQPGGTTSGQRPGPDFFVNSTATPSLRNAIDVIVAVAGQLATLAGDA